MESNTCQIAIIGAGFAGLGAAIRLKKSGREDFIILERASEVGGTWRDNIYPGCGCDVPSYLYSFSFEQNPDWSRSFSRQPEILDYLKHCVEKYELGDKILYNANVIRVQFIEEKNTWILETKDGRVLEARIVIPAIGPLNQPNIPDIEGLQSFPGPRFHSSQWDYEVDLKDKKVAVIGTGASAIQLVPEVSKEASSLCIFQRTAPWVLPKSDNLISESRKKRNRKIPFQQHLIRKLIYWFYELRFSAFKGNQFILSVTKFLWKKNMKRQIQDPELRKAITPNYELGCKRILLSNEYYPALEKENVQLINSGVSSIKGNKLTSTKGDTFEADAVIFATGFVAADYIRDINIIGKEGRSLFEEWKQHGAEAYFGITVNGYPNMLFLVGPNTGLGHNSIIYMIESQLNYVMDFVEKLEANETPNAALEVRKEVQDRFNANIQEKLKHTVWASGCMSWYLNKDGRNTTLWPDYTISYRKQTKAINANDYEWCSTKKVSNT